MYPIEVRFLDESNEEQGGELLTPNRPNSDGSVDVQYVGDHEIDVVIWNPVTDELHIVRTHISRVSSMRQVAYA